MVHQVILNFHGIGEPARILGNGEQDYWIATKNFEIFLEAIKRAKPDTEVLITFDDGNVSDVEIALPALVRHGLSATFFVLAGRLDKPGSLGRDHLREMIRAGMKIGTHGFDHVDWRQLDDDGVERELRTAKLVLEAAAGCEITEVAIPFGLYDRRVLGLLRHAGYRRVYTSDGGLAESDEWIAPRTSPRAGMGADDARRLLVGRDSVVRGLRRRLAMLKKRLLPL